MNIRPAQATDEHAVRRFLARAAWVFAAHGDEDLALYLGGQNGFRGWLAEDGRQMTGFLALSARRSQWADVRGLALAQAQAAGVQPLFDAARRTLTGPGFGGLMCIATSAWLPRVLIASGFVAAERIITYERPLADFVAPPLADGGCVVLPAGGQALDDILAVDAAAFDPMWQMERREMMTHILTASRTAVAQCAGQVVGYAVTHVHNRDAQIIRLAVHPLYQGQGLGRRLLVDALYFCQVRGARRVTLNTQESNDTSQRLYRSVAFRPVGKPVPVLVGRA